MRRMRSFSTNRTGSWQSITARQFCLPESALPRIGYFVGTPFMAGHCVSKQIGRHDAACQGCPRCVSRSPEARCLRAFARAVRVSQPAVLSALLVIQLFGIVIPPPYFPKEHQKERCGHFSVAALLHYVLWCASEYSVAGRISCHVSYDNIETNVCQWLFAENFSC